MKKNIKVKDIVVKTGSDFFLPIALVLGAYVILHGHLSPGGGFQGGVIVAAGVVLVYLGYGHAGLKKVFNEHALKLTEILAAIFYVTLGMLGIIYGFNFCRNVLFEDMSPAGYLLSSGTIFWMNFAVGLKVLTGVGFLTIMIIGLLNEKNEEKK